MTEYRRLPTLAPLTISVLMVMVSLPVAAAVITETTFDQGALPASPYSYAFPSNAGVVAHGINANGTIDVHNGTASQALFLNADFASAAGGSWSAGVSTNQIPVTNAITNRRLLSVGFDLWANRALPVRAIIRSYSASGALTGRSERVLYPPIADSYYRHVLDVSEFDAAVGGRRFDPSSPRFELTVQIEGRDGAASSWPKAADNIIRIDNISYTSPRYFVSNTGDNADPGSEAQPLKTIGEAIRRAQPGDVIVVRGGTYSGATSTDTTATFAKAGSPSRWITLRAYPGETPVLQTRDAAWNNIALNYQAAYIELRGLTVRGNASRITLAEAEAAAAGSPMGYHNANGISVDARYSAGSTPAPFNQRAHHIRIVDNTVFEHSGGGISAIEADYVTIAGNNVHSNAWWMRYGGSGISLFHAWNLHTRADDYRMYVIGNVARGNRCYIPWVAVGRISDGNGIIIDDFQNKQESSTIFGQPYAGRTLVQNNSASINGGAGMQTFQADRVVFANNTAYLNNQSPTLNYGQIRASSANDVQIVNNIMYAAAGREINGTRNSTNVINQYNQYYRAGGDGAPPAGSGNIWATGGWQDANGGNFELRGDSAARDSGTQNAVGAPRVDLLGQPRPLGVGLDRGAYEYAPPAASTGRKLTLPAAPAAPPLPPRFPMPN